MYLSVARHQTLCCLLHTTCVHGDGYVSIPPRTQPFHARTALTDRARVQGAQRDQGETGDVCRRIIKKKVHCGVEIVASRKKACDLRWRGPLLWPSPVISWPTMLWRAFFLSPGDRKRSADVCRVRTGMNVHSRWLVLRVVYTDSLRGCSLTVVKMTGQCGVLFDCCVGHRGRR